VQSVITRFACEKSHSHKTENIDITKREIEVLELICKGMSNTEIAEKLFISKRTVDKHRENLLLKTGSKTQQAW